MAQVLSPLMFIFAKLTITCSSLKKSFFLAENALAITNRNCIGAEAWSGNVFLGHSTCVFIQGEIIYAQPTPLTHFLAARHFSGEGSGRVYFSGKGKGSSLFQGLIF